ncbi:hypothetical protein GCM10020229_31650 [Kitasatospora albolonga]|uniref:hypothetical protein n=1 Tax=Kitasatospora albolonga TaxID=68173 RepID=UPI0031E910E0
MNTHQPISDAELAEIEELANAATPGPWHVRQLDDAHAMSLVAISTVPDTGLGERWPDFDHQEIIAATLVQQPRYLDVTDGLWDQNAQFIADARQDVPRLIAEIRRLRHLLAANDRP